MNYSTVDLDRARQAKRGPQAPGGEQVYLSDLYTSGLRKSASKPGAGEARAPMVLAELEGPQKGALRPGFASGAGAEAPREPKPRKKKKKESGSVSVSKELLSALMEGLLRSPLSFSQALYRRLLQLLFESLELVETKAKSLFGNRSLVVNYLELMLKLLVRRDVALQPFQAEALFGRPGVFPLKLRLKEKKTGAKKSVLAKLDRKLGKRITTLVFGNRRHSSQVLLAFRRIAQKAQALLGFDVEEAVKRMSAEKEFSLQSKRGMGDQLWSPRCRSSSRSRGPERAARRSRAKNKGNPRGAAKRRRRGWARGGRR